jgi:hypothetical protein
MRECLGFFTVVLMFGFLLTLPKDSWAQSVTVSAEVPDTTVTFSGVTSPGAFVTILDNATVVGTVTADSNGGFTKTLSNQQSGTHSFGITAQDLAGTTSIQYSFVVSLTFRTETVISNIVIPPTIGIDRASFPAGETLNISGQTAPNATVTVFIYSDLKTETTTSGSDGKWTLAYGKEIEVGAHTTYAKTTTAGGLQSTSSKVLEFTVTAAPVSETTQTVTPTTTASVTTETAPSTTQTATCGSGKGDNNCDGKINLTDFSIMLYDWNGGSGRSDLNKDGAVNLVDFSVMMYHWTG